MASSVVVLRDWRGVRRCVPVRGSFCPTDHDCRRPAAMDERSAGARAALRGDLIEGRTSTIDRRALIQRAIDLSRNGDRAGAEAVLEAACADAPDDTLTLHALGAFYCEGGSFHQALPFLAKAAALAPANACYRRDLSIAELATGNITAAMESLFAVLAMDPSIPGIVDNLASLIEAPAELRRLAGIIENLSGGELTSDRQIEVAFASATVSLKLGDPVGAFDGWRHGNALKRANLRFDIETETGGLRDIAEAFDADLFSRHSGSGSRSVKPIFIVGMPRSGSTLVQQILTRHSQVRGVGELPLLPRLVGGTTGPNGEPFPAWTGGLTDADCRAFGDAYLNGLPENASARMVDKRLENFRYLGLIKLCLPNAVIIHCARDPRDVGLSCFSLRFADGQPYSYDLVELGQYWRAYSDLMAHWSAVLPRGSILDVPYEAVVSDVEGWARRLIEHCGLDWEPDCVRFQESSNPVSNYSAAQVRRPVYTDSIGRWRAFARDLQPMIEAMEL